MRRSRPAALREFRQRLIDEAVAGGPDALSDAQRAALLGDPLARGFARAGGDCGGSRIKAVNIVNVVNIAKTG
jgi:hypothetical protein